MADPIWTQEKVEELAWELLDIQCAYGTTLLIAGEAGMVKLIAALTLDSAKHLEKKYGMIWPHTRGSKQ